MEKMKMISNLQVTWRLAIRSIGALIMNGENIVKSLFTLRLYCKYYKTNTFKKDN